jgi:hypothetical protein
MSNVRPKMQFRVTSVAAEESAPALREATVKLERWLNASLHDGEFGEGLDQFSIVVISVEDDPSQNESWLKAQEKSGKAMQPFTGEPIRYLSVAVEVLPHEVRTKGPRELLVLVSARAKDRLATRPKRVPRGVDYARLSAAVGAALAAYV